MPVYLPGLTFGGLGYGGASYGYSPYGSGAAPRAPVPVSGGYGGAPYGYASYGSVDITPPRVTGVNSLDGYRVEVFFSEAMADNADLVTAGNYVFTDTYGVALTSVSVARGTVSGLGYSSVIVTHTGSALGGQYTLTVSNVTDIAGNVVGPSPVNSAVFYALGDAASAVVGLPSPDDGRTVQVDFVNSLGSSQDMLTETAFTPGVDSTASYGITTIYPVAPTLGSATQDATVLSRVLLDVHPMTSASYDLTLGPALAFNYNGTLLPDDDPNLTGVEIGTGSSVATASDGLLLTKAGGVQYGWSFGDTTGRMIPGTTYRVDFTFDLTAATITPIVFNSTLATMSVSDGAIQVNLTLSDSAGVKVITITSGAYTSTVIAAWDTSGVHSVSLIRNQKGDFYTVLFDGVPLNTFTTASATGPAVYGAGAAFVLSASHAVTLFKLRGVENTSSTTLFTSAWNFIHGLPTTFTGSTVLTGDRIKTRYGPLVRGWGDNTPATKADVEVRLDGGVIDLAGVNPYVGEIYPTIPIPLAAAGTFSVEVDYIWFMTPAMEMGGLNTRGLTLNTWDRSTGHTAGVPSPIPDGATGTVKTNRFPMGVALGPYKRQSPKQIGHKYIGFQKGGYSALLNEPTTMLLNQNPRAIGVGGLSADALRASGSFNGQTVPGDADTPWALDGVDGGGLVGDGTYRVVDASSGPYGVGEAALWTRDLDLSLDIQITDIARFKVESYTADGVFTGVGFGFHDGAHLVVVGALLVDGVQHVGVLLDGTKTHLEEGWQIGPSVDGETTTTTTITVAYADLPSGIESGDRFRIPEGPQAGVYTIGGCGLTLSEDGVDVTITFSPALPVDPDTLGAGEVTLLFETPWDENLISFRVYSHFPTGSASVYLGGGVSGLVADLAEVAPFPAQTALLLPATEKGVMFWGSLSRRAKSSSIWDLTQYLADPPRITNTVQGITALTEMNTLPEDDPNDPWYRVGNFGTASVDSTGDQVLLKATSGDAAIPVEFTYERAEPYLTPKVRTDAEATLLVDSGILGAGNASYRLRDTEREALLTTLHYVEDGTRRRLIPTRPNVSLSGLQTPVDSGWTAASSNTAPDPFVRGQTLELTKSATQVAGWSRSVDFGSVVDDEGLILESRFSVQSSTVGTRGIGIAIGGQCHVAANLGRSLYLTLGTGTVDLRDQTYAVVASFAYAWNDGVFHAYRLLCDPAADIVVLVIDDTIVGSTPFTGFSTSPITRYLEASLLLTGDGACAVTVDSLSATSLRAAPRLGQTLDRTFGVYLRRTPTGGDPTPDDIDSYRIPRTDGANALNSSMFATPEPMDWTVACRVRMYLDPNWGLSVYRPDLLLPPGAPGTALPSETTDPAAAWINVERGDLPPYVSGSRGTVAFGSLDPRAISQTRWDSVRYRIRGSADGFGLAPQNMVLNRSFTLTSGEYNLDTTPETATIISRTPFLVYIPDSAIYADRVFVVQVDGSVISSTLYTFDKSTQNLQFDSTAALPSAQHPVTVTFAVGKPVTQHYLCNQPLEETVTVLNEGTPPVPSDFDQPAERTIEAGSAINDPEDVLDDAESLVLNDPLRVVTFTDDGDSIYADLQFCETNDGDSVHITTLCDGPGPGHGLAEIGIDGHFTTDAHTVPNGPAGPWKGSPAIKGSTARFNQSSILTAGGGILPHGMLLGGGAATPSASVLYPNQRGPSGKVPEGRMGVNQDFAIRLEDVTPRADTFDIQGTLSDNVPPTSADPSTDPNPDAAPTGNGNGGAAYTLVDYAAVTASRLGPWGGLTALQTRSLLAGGSQLSGDEFRLEGGQQIPAPTVTTGYIRAAN